MPYDTQSPEHAVCFVQDRLLFRGLNVTDGLANNTQEVLRTAPQNRHLFSQTTSPQSEGVTVASLFCHTTGVRYVKESKR